MEAKKYEALVARLETRALANYRFFRWRVIAYLAWGYFLMLALLVLIVLGAVGMLLARFIGMAIRYFAFGVYFSKGVVRGMWIKVSPPPEIQVDRNIAEPLFRVVDEVCQELKAPPIHSVFVSTVCNAFAFERPKFGPFGPFKNEITLGLPLLATFDVEELRGVIAHEIGHIHRGHSRFALRVEQISKAWEGSLRETQSKGMKAQQLAKIVGMYSPRLSAFKVVLSKMAERQANAAEAAVVGEDISARILTALAVYVPETASVMRSLTIASFSEETMPIDFATRLYHGLQHPIGEQVVMARVSESLHARTDPLASHPTMTQALTDLQVEPKLDKVLGLASHRGQQSAGDALLGPKLPEFLAFVDKAWVKEFGEGWLKERQAYLKSQNTIDHLLETARTMPPTVEEVLQLSAKLREQGRADEALTWIEPIKDRNPETRFIHALTLRDVGDPSWVQSMEGAIAEMHYRREASRILMHHYTSIGDRPNVQRLANVLQEVNAIDEQAANNYRRLTAYWSYIPCQWSEEDKRVAIDILSRQSGIARAYLVDRTTRDPRHRNTCLIVKTKWYVSGKTTLLNKITAGQPFPRQVMVFVTDKIPREVTQMPGALIFEPSGKPATSRSTPAAG